MELPNALVEASVTRGAILHSTIFEYIDHGKFFVVIGVSQDCIAGFFFINSNISMYIQDKPEQMKMQYPILERDYDFLRYDSFLSATQIETIPISKIVNTIKAGMTTYIGRLKDKHIKQLLEMVRGSKLFSKREK